MSRGRTSRNASPLRRACRSVFHTEALEQRTLLTTLVGGQSFDYLDANDNVIRITLRGTIEAEFIGARVRKSDNRVIIRDLVQAPPPNSDVEIDGVNLFQIYVNEAGPDGQIIISEVTGQRRNSDAQPYGAGTEEWKINDNGGSGGDPINVDTGANTGAVLIGAVTVDLEATQNFDESGTPIYTNTYRLPFGVRPATKGLVAGIETAPGVSFDKLMIGGSVMGRIFIGGSLNTLYAGNLFLGNAEGLLGSANTTLNNNFFVGSHLRNLLVSGSVGTDGISSPGDADYRTGVDMRIGGRLGNVKVLGDFLGSIEVVDNPEVDELTDPFAEVEYKLASGETAGLAFLNGNISASGFANDSFTNIQYGHTLGSIITGNTEAMDFAGSLSALKDDLIDTYALPLIAGQQPTILLQGEAQVGVFDPLGRLIATDIADAGGRGPNEQFRFTAELPGTYRIVVANFGDDNFDGNPPVAGSLSYILSVQNMGTVSLGGLQATNMKLEEPDFGSLVRKGDWGAINAAGSIYGSYLSPIIVSRGNLRDVGATGDIGSIDRIQYHPPTFVVPRGTFGYLHSGGLMNVNQDVVTPEFEPLLDRTIGFDYQRIEVGGALYGNFTARGAIRTVYAGSIPTANTFFANVDRRGNDGLIDLIDVAGNFGSSLTGGPAIYTGPGGNVKYIRVGGTVFRDSGAFGGTLVTDIQGDPGEVLRLVDDSGAIATFTPTSYRSGITNTIGSLTATYYGIRESGGGVVINLTSSTGVTMNVQNAGSFDIADLVSTNTSGSETQYNAATGRISYGTGTVATAGPAVPIPITLGGRGVVNVMQIRGQATGALTSVVNSTAGEIGGIAANSVGIISATSLGYLKGTSATKVLAANNAPSYVAATALPFNAYSFGVYTTGPVIDVQVREALGTFFTQGTGARAGIVGNLRVNSDQRSSRGSFDGIIGPVAAEVFNTVDVGRGIASAGTGSVVGGGLFAIESANSIQAAIRNVRANNADIRGTIASEGTIGAINISNGSLAGALVTTVASISRAVFNDTKPRTIPDRSPQNAATGFALGQIAIRGNGGIIGSNIDVGSFGAIGVNGGFGILSSTIGTSSATRASNIISTSGLGIRNTVIDIGSSLNTIEATGDGRRLNLKSFNPSVLNLARGKFDPYTGRALGTSNDLFRSVGTTPGTPVLSGATNAGIIENVDASGLLNLGKIRGFMFRSANTTTEPTSNSFPMRLQFANGIGSITAANAIEGLRVVTGRLDSVTTGGNLGNANFDIAGRIGDITVGGILRASTLVNARGPQGAINSVFVRRGMLGNIFSNQGVVSALVGSLGGKLEANDRIETLTIRGDVLVNAFVRAGDGIGTLTIGGDVQNSAVISAKRYGSVTVGGRIDGRIITQ